MIDLLKQQPFWGLLGVVIGFILGEVSRIIREQIRIKKLKRILKQELRTIYKTLDQKIKHSEDVINGLEQQIILPGLTVGTINIGYRKNINDLYNYLSVLERNCLHVIYERIKISDSLMNTFEKDIKIDIKDGIVKDPFTMYKSRFEQLNWSYSVIQALINSYLEGKPKDVFYID